MMLCSIECNLFLPIKIEKCTKFKKKNLVHFFSDTKLIEKSSFLFNRKNEKILYAEKITFTFL